MESGANLGRNIVIGGTYGVGKTTTTEAVSRATGIPPAVARGMREILAEVFPQGKLLEHCTGAELLHMCLIRFGERSAQEGALPNGFVSDGSVVHEATYAWMRSQVDANNDGRKMDEPGFLYAMDAYLRTAKKHGRDKYTDIIHLPIEFALPADGHRPVSEEFRHGADRVILETWEKLGFRPHIIGGTVSERVRGIVSALGLRMSSTLDGPVELADGTLLFENIDDILGAGHKRYFSSGFANIAHQIHDLKISPDSLRVEGVMDVRSSSWSQKDGKQCEFHLTSIDALRVTGQLTQVLLYAQDGLQRSETNNMWLRDMKMVPKKPVTGTADIPVKCRVTDTKLITTRTPAGRKSWRTMTTVADIGAEGFMVEFSVAHELPARLQPGFQDAKPAPTSELVIA